MLYGAKVAVLIGLAALVLERVAAWRRLPRRGLWASALVLSLVVPVLAVLTPARGLAPPIYLTRAASRTVATPNAGEVYRAADAAAPFVIKSFPESRHLSLPNRASVERVLRAAWLAASFGLGILYALGLLRLRVAARHWPRERIGGQEVWVTEALGPAVYGLLRPIILMPRWALNAPNDVRAVVLAHEQEHIAARDPALLLLGLILVAISPWNLPLWWQLRRLRFAIEGDCDARALGRGAGA